ncbi:MAG: hypothetical protein AB2693_25590 [Candidatus Thiodiazotropha sp.]
MERKADLEKDQVEGICAKVTISPCNSFLLVTSYVPPEKKDQLLGLINVLEECKDFKHMVLTGDLNCKSLEWNNNKSNTCGVILEEYLHRSGLLCVNDGLPTRRLSESVIDLFIVSPKVVPERVRCETLSQDRIRSDHIGVLLEVYEEKEKDLGSMERYLLSKADWESGKSVLKRNLEHGMRQISSGILLTRWRIPLWRYTQIV